MKAFQLKYKWTIIFWLAFLFVILYFAPRQSDYYLDTDIKYFKAHYLTPAVLWTGVFICLMLLFIFFIKTKSIKQSVLAFLYGSAMVAFFLFVFQDLFLAGALFLNRQVNKDSLQKIYIVNYMAGVGQTKENFIPYDLAAKQISIDRKLINKLYNPELKQNDTVALKLERGLFGIVFQQPAFADK